MVGKRNWLSTGIALGVLAMAFMASPIAAQEATATASILKYEYSAEDLKAAVDEADEEKGVKRGEVFGVVTRTQGTFSETYGATFTQTLTAGQYSTVNASRKGTLLTANNIWMMLATALVFIMHLGFAMIESGLTQAKNTVNILFKNVMIVSIGLLTYTLIGFNLMYPGDFADFLGGGVLGFAGFGIDAGTSSSLTYAKGGYTYWTDFLFQGMFAATAATIVSGAVAERVKLGSFLLFSLVYVSLVYPIIGSWQWGGGFLSEWGFHDFAGSTLVHSVGGWAALAGVIFLGARHGKYTVAGSQAIPGHSMPLATIGMFLLWLGWFGFNGGSVLSADPDGTSYVLVTTSLAAASGIMGAMLLSTIISKKPDLSMALNGALAGLVGITAGADVLSISMAIIVGFIAGLIVVTSVITLDKLKLDDPVGAISVHLVCGIWGTMAVGFADGKSFGSQSLGVLFAALLAFPAAAILFAILKYTIGIRVNKEEELKGLDIGEHGMEAYGGFQIFDMK